VRQDHKTQPILYDEPQNPNSNPTASASVAATAIGCRSKEAFVVFTENSTSTIKKG